MRSHDVRRTGRATVNGPRKGDRVWKYAANDGVSINIEAAVTSRGVFFGTWGLTRRFGADQTNWDKFDGKMYGLNLTTGQPLWPPLHPGKTPYSYRYAGREPTQQDRPGGPGLHWNYSNGTVEGTPAVDPVTGHLYIGRGDGILYAVDPKRGRVLWKFKTLDPKRPDDPEGGGEIIGGPLVTSGGMVVFATFAAPHRPNPPKLIRHETNAVYAVHRQGKLLWRYPKAGSLEAPFIAPPALAPDGKRVYAVTGLPDKKFPCELLALELSSGKLAWKLDLGVVGGQDLAVGSNGVIYVAGMEIGPLGAFPTTFAVTDRGNRGKIVWGPVALDGKRPRAHVAAGLALYEQAGRVRDVWVSSSATRDVNPVGGKLYRLEPASGKVTASWDPEKAAPSCAGGLTDVTLDNEGVIYVGVRGRWKTFNSPETFGRMYALRASKGGCEVLWSLEVEGLIDWASPAIGPNGGLYFGSTAKINPIAQILPRDPREDVPDADPLFYGVTDGGRR